MKNTKRTLIMSVLSMVICVAMLAGTTFAWFTDTASTGVNRIQAGNLDVDLIMDKEEDGNYVSISGGTGDVFSEAAGNGINWEPGKTEIVYLGVKNNGSLAIKYNILLDITDNGLAEALEYAIVDGAKAADLASVTDWSTLKSAAGEQTGAMPVGQAVAAPNGRITTTGGVDYFALAVYMKEEAGNAFNSTEKNIVIDMTVVATQATFEEDSFGADYDAGAAEKLAHKVMVKGIAGFEDKEYKTMQEAYTAIRPTISALAGLDQATATNAQFDAVFTAGGKVTWQIWGRHTIDNSLMLSFGRAAAYYNPDRWFNTFEVVGMNEIAEVTMQADITLPRNWWTYTADPISLSFNNITLTEKNGGQISAGQANAYDINVNLIDCTVNGNIYLYHNNVLNMNVKNTVFNSRNDSYALMLQGERAGEICIDNCTFNGYSRGVNFERKFTAFVLTNCTFISTRSESDRGVIQFTDGSSFLVSGNTIDVNGGNAFWFHEAAKNEDVTYEIKDNDVKAPYLANSDAKFEVNSKITSSGNKFNSTDTANCMEKNATAPTRSTVIING